VPANATNATRGLETLLAVILVLSLATWALMPETALLPRSPGGVAGGVALLAGGDFFELLPENAEWMSDEELEAHFKDLGVKGFCMGWGQLEDGQESLMICPVGDGSWMKA
jgi:hypothetical protein